jgi:two-component system phosphate regulon response regulator PhoB
MANVLVVDDMIDTCRLLVRIMSSLGHSAEYATSGTEAMRFLESRVPDLIVLDVMMPGMGGEEVLRRVRRNERTAAVPVIMWSAVSDELYQQHLLKSGANDYWVKASMDLHELNERIRLQLPPPGSALRA